MDTVVINNITKKFEHTTAIDDLTLTIPTGQMTGIIGADAAGKTTLLRIIIGLLCADSGTVTTLGYDPARQKKELIAQIGYMPQKFGLYEDLSVRENLEFYADLKSVDKNFDELLDFTGLRPFQKRLAGNLSGGMKQKLALCCALIHRPAVLLLDEPTTGVDAVSRSEFWDMLSDLKRRGISMLVSTPYMDEARRCDRIALCDRGHLLGVDTPQGIVRGFGGRLYALSGGEMYGLLVAARREPGVEECYPFGEAHHLVAGPDFDPEGFVRRLAGQGFRGVVLRPAEPGIEDVFIKRMHHE